MKKVLLAGGSGLIGRRLSTLLQAEGYEVLWLSRTSVNAGGIKVYHWNPEKNEMDPEALRAADVIISLAGRSISEGRWTPAVKEEIINSRTRAAATLISALNRHPNRVTCLIAASATGIYGDRKDCILTESSPPGAGFLSKTTLEWEQSYASSPVRTVILRTGIVLAREGGALPVMAAPLRMGVCPIAGTGNQYISWIHIDDLCRMYLFALKNEALQGAYNAIAPAAVSQREFMLSLRQIVAPLAIPLKVPASLLRVLLGEKSVLALESARVSPARIRQSGFQFQYDDLIPALKNLYGQ